MACLVLICQSRLERKTVKRKRVFATLKVLGSVLGQLTDELPEEVRSTVFSNIILFMAAHTLILQLLILWTISGLFWEFELLCFFQATIFFFFILSLWKVKIACICNFFTLFFQVDFIYFLRHFNMLCNMCFDLLLYSPAYHSPYAMFLVELGASKPSQKSR